LVKALELGKSIYSLHNHPKMDKGLIKKIKNGGGLAQVQSSPFMERFVSEHGGTIKGAYAMVMSMPRLFDFHTRLRHDLVVDLYILAH
jgi:predicted RNA methylase